MDVPLTQHHHPKAVTEIQSGAGDQTPLTSTSNSIKGLKSFIVVDSRKKKKKKLAADSGSASSACSNNCCSSTLSSKTRFKLFRNAKRIRVGSTTTRRSMAPRDVDALGLPLGMSIAAVVAQVMESKNMAREKISEDYLSALYFSSQRIFSKCFREQV